MTEEEATPEVTETGDGFLNRFRFQRGTYDALCEGQPLFVRVETSSGMEDIALARESDVEDVREQTAHLPEAALGTVMPVDVAALCEEWVDVGTYEDATVEIRLRD